MNTRAIVKELKQSEEDYEWYPTTPSMAARVARHMKLHGGSRSPKILDIGAGNGSLFKYLENVGLEIYKKFAIEKSDVLINKMPADVIIVGTDFYHNTLIDKNVDFVFCNPPYSDYVSWMVRILREANADHGIYLIVPERWKENAEIKNVMKHRDIQATVLFEDDFLNADRSARSRVQCLYYNTKRAQDAFREWAYDYFNVDESDDFDDSEWAKAKRDKAKIQNALVCGKNIVVRLVNLYEADMKRLNNSYTAILALDSEFMKEIGLNVNKLLFALQEKIKGLKTLYWNEVFNRLDSVTSRLSKKSRESLSDFFQEHCSVDLTPENIYAVAIWVIKNANQYFAKQLIELYEQIADEKNVVNYKSNQRIYGGFRYRDDKFTHYRLDYRLVLTAYDTFSEDSWRTYGYQNGLGERAHEYINDIITVAKTLGFDVQGSTYEIEWEPGAEEIFYLGSGKEFCRLRVYKNGNIHFRPCKSFIKALNVEMGRLAGWVHTKEEAASEMDLSPSEIEKHWNGLKCLSVSDGQKLLT